ncbi:phosphatidylglycerophosphatase A [Advenella sp. RU8]|uniref:phosphatidylglycerophosphatase A family protein n=1 Tax=Advenella sp. RU8 TaxID=3399575 RepID=UPI003AB0A24C
MDQSNPQQQSVFRRRSLSNKKNPVNWPSFSWVTGNIHRFCAFGLGSGLLRPASGTWGTLLAWLLWWPLHQVLGGEWLMGLFLLFAFLYGTYCCHYTAKELKTDDHGGIVWDEFVAFWLVLFIIAPMNLVWQLVAFVLFRFFDIVKPSPIRYFDAKLKNGFGIMWDDLLASAYTLFVLAILMRLVGI